MYIGKHLFDGDDLEADMKEYEWVQTAVTNFRTYDLPNYRFNLFAIWRKLYKRIPLIIHGTWLTSITKDVDHKQCKYSRRYIERLNDISLSYDIDILYVMHVGKIHKDMPHIEAFHNMIGNLMALDLKSDRFKLCLENDAGSKKGSKLCCAHGLWILNKQIKRDWLSYCFDTEHAYASAFDRKLWLDFVDISSVVHFNPIPEIVEGGSHLDRHGKFFFEDSKEIPLLKRVHRRAMEKKLPIILENTTPETIQGNASWVRKNC